MAATVDVDHVDPQQQGQHGRLRLRVPRRLSVRPPPLLNASKVACYKNVTIQVLISCGFGPDHIKLPACHGDRHRCPAEALGEAAWRTAGTGKKRTMADFDAGDPGSAKRTLRGCRGCRGCLAWRLALHEDLEALGPRTREHVEGYLNDSVVLFNAPGRQLATDRQQDAEELLSAIIDANDLNAYFARDALTTITCTTCGSELGRADVTHAGTRPHSFVLEPDCTRFLELPGVRTLQQLLFVHHAPEPMLEESQRITCRSSECGQRKRGATKSTTNDSLPDIVMIQLRRATVVPLPTGPPLRILLRKERRRNGCTRPEPLAGG